MKKYRGWKMPKKYYHPRKFNGKCEKCGKKTQEAYSHTDDSNIAISHNALYLCKECEDEARSKP